MIHLNTIHFGYQVTWIDTLLFALGAFVFIRILLFYHYKLTSKQNKFTESIFENPIYQTKDVLLQDKVASPNYFPVKKTVSIWSKIVLYIIIGFLITIPFFELIGIESFY